MTYFTIRNRIPDFISKPLFGDRKKYGLVPDITDPCWNEWQIKYLDFYFENQKKSIGEKVNNAGYSVMSKLDLSGKQVLEIGPGEINHIQYWKGKPQCYTIADIQQSMLDISSEKLKKNGICHKTVLLEERGAGLPFDDEIFDVIVSFYSLEHLSPLNDHISEIIRILKETGSFVGAIPCEGGISWGFGRFLTSRRWLLKNTTINPDKIICWEHPNYADQILHALDTKMCSIYLSYWPFYIPSIDINLVLKYIYRK